MYAMKKQAVYILLFLAIAVPRLSFGAESVISFDARISVQNDATIEVTERIVQDFAEAKEKHGIFRVIPYSYQAGTETYTADITFVLVTDENGTPIPFNESRGNGELTLKIGDPDVVISGVRTYEISYTVEGPFLYFEDHDELYWNVTGYWPYTVASSSVLVDLPVGAKVLLASCYKGREGSNEKCDSDEQLVNYERAGYLAKAENIGAGEGFSIAVAFPKGQIVEKQKPWETEDTFISNIVWPFVIPLLVFLYMIRLWSTRGRDPKGRSVIVTEFSPPKDCIPSFAGIILHEKITGKEISAEIVRLAIEGYIKIHRYERKVIFFSITDYVLERIGKEMPKDEVGKLILEKIFNPAFEDVVEIEGKDITGTLVSKMQHAFVAQKKTIDSHIEKEVVRRKYFATEPTRERKKYALIGVIIVFVGSGAAIFFENIYTIIALPLSGLIVAIIGYVMPVKTPEGVRIKEHLLGFKKYLDVAEKDRIDFHSSPEQHTSEPERTMELFDACLPYAIVFGVEEKWAKQFKDIYIEEPSWYSGGVGNAFSPVIFASDFSHFTSQMSSASVPKSSGVGGGGSVGGGFGGGRGGSW